MQDVKNSEQSKYNKVTRLTVQKTVLPATEAEESEGLV